MILFQILPRCHDVGVDVEVRAAKLGWMTSTVVSAGRFETNMSSEALIPKNLWREMSLCKIVP